MQTNLSNLSTADLSALIADAQTELASRAPAKAFTAESFRAAFSSAPGHHMNYVLLADLRAAMGCTREAFDLGLRSLRIAKEFSLDSADGMHVKLTDAQRADGIMECGSNLVYCQKSER